jgi:hypothetical protein
MASKHDFQESETRIFPREGLDDPNQLEPKREIQFFAHAAAADQRSLEAKHGAEFRLILPVGRTTARGFSRRNRRLACNETRTPSE